METPPRKKRRLNVSQIITSVQEEQGAWTMSKRQTGTADGDIATWPSDHGRQFISTEYKDKIQASLQNPHVAERKSNIIKLFEFIINFTITLTAGSTRAFIRVLALQYKGVSSVSAPEIKTMLSRYQLPGAAGLGHVSAFHTFFNSTSSNNPDFEDNYEVLLDHKFQLNSSGDTPHKAMTYKLPVKGLKLFYDTSTNPENLRNQISFWVLQDDDTWSLGNRATWQGIAKMKYISV